MFWLVLVVDNPDVGRTLPLYPILGVGVSLSCMFLLNLNLSAGTFFVVGFAALSVLASGVELNECFEPELSKSAWFFFDANFAASRCFSFSASFYFGTR